MKLYTTIEVEEQDIEVSVDFNYYPAIPALIEFTSDFTDLEGNVYTPTEKEIKRIENEADELYHDYMYERFDY